MRKLVQFTTSMFAFVFLLTHMGFTQGNIITDDDPEPLTSFFENFDDLETPDLPDGWSTFIQSGSAFSNIETTTIGNPFSLPNHLRFSNSNDADAMMILSTAEVTNFGSNWLTFMAKMSSATHSSEIVVGYTSNPSSAAAFVGLDTVLVQGNEAEMKFVLFPGLEDIDEYHIAFRYLPENTFRTMYIDDMNWDLAPTTPAVQIFPEENDFGLVDIDAQAVTEVSLQNSGIGVLMINDGDLVIIGDDADLFSFSDSIVYPIELALGESITFELSFLPTSEGAKNAQLQITSNDANSPFLYELNGTGLGTIASFFEDFDDVETPHLPGGWSYILNGTAGDVETVTVTFPFSAPNHVRMRNQGDANARHILVAPKTTDFETNWLRFYSKLSATAHVADLVVGYMSDRNDLETFIAVDTIGIEGNNYERFTVQYGDILTETDEYHVAFKFAPSNTFRNLFLDDIAWEAAPTDPVYIVSPEEFDFELQQINESSPEAEFTITSDGLAPLIITPDDIEITNDATGVFILSNITETVELAFGESITVGVTFAPILEGEKTATLNVFDTEIALMGEGSDATIVETPHFENFDQVSAPELPFGWSGIVDNPTFDGALVETTTATSPFSSPNHVRIFSNDDVNANVMLISPPVVDLDEKRIRFWSRANLATNVPDLIIGTMSNPNDATTFTAFQTFTGADEITNSYQQYIVAFDETIGENQYIAFKHGATPSFNRSLFIDDVIIEQDPVGPQLAVYPSSIDFGKYQIGTSSLPYELVLTNEGYGDLILLADDFFITGANADRFILGPVADTITLGEFESFVIRVAFAPENLGMKEAILMIDDHEVALSGEGMESTITELPHEEDFDDVEAPALPLGWTAIVDNPDYADAAVLTLTTNAPNSSPNHVQLLSNNYEDQNVMLISPPIDDLNTTRVRFYAKCNLATNVPDLIVGTMSDPSDVSTFNPLMVITGDEDFSTSHQMFTVALLDAGDDKHIAFRHGGTPNFNRSIFIDDIVIEVIPDEPLLVITPDEHLFDAQQIGTATNPVEFELLNDGGGILTLTAADIQIIGDDAEHFILNNLTDTVNLASGESTIISVAFAPTTTGIKAATLDVDGTEVPLSGEGLDATISSYPWEEDFTGVSAGTIPFGWSRGHSNWAAVNTSNAGGNSPEIRFNWSPAFTGVSRLVSPPFNTTDYDELMFSFRHSVNNYMAPGSYTLRVISMVGENENILFEWIDPDNVPAEQLSVILGEDHGVGQEETMFIVFEFDGTSNDINQWFLDDLVMEEAPDRYTVTFNVEDEDGNAITDAIVTFNNITNEAGDYVFDEIFEGTYNYSVVADHYEAVSGQDIFVDQDIAIDVVMDHMLYTITFNVVDENDNPVTNATITFDGETADQGVYVFADLMHGTYDYSIEAEHFETLTVTDFEVTQDETVTAELISVTYTVTFTVEDEDGAAINDAVITLADVTNAAGDYVFDNVNFGTYNYTVVADHFESYSGTDLLVEEDTAVDVILTATLYTVTFNVEDTDGNVINNAVITFDGVTNDEGNYVFENIAYGSYDYSITADHFETLSVTGFMVEEDVTIDAELDHTLYTVTFVVEDEEGSLIDDAVVTFDGVANAAGDYVFAGIIHGMYDYTVEAVGYITVDATDFEVTEDVTVNVEMQLVTYTVTFTVEDTDGAEINNAIITFGDITNPEGDYVFTSVQPGFYDYTVTALGYQTIQEIDYEVTQDVIIPVILEELPETFAVTFHVDMTDADGFDPETHEVYIAGGFGGDMEWNAPGTNPDLVLARVDNSMIFSITLALEAGDYEYKYASNAFGEGWEGAEWPGDPNRDITVADDMLVEDIWGIHPDDVSVADLPIASLNIYPNPARSNVNIVSDSFISEVRIVDMLGNVVYSTSVGNDHYQINVSSLKDGIYFVQIQTERGFATRKLQITK